MILQDDLIAYLNDYLAVRDIPDYREAYNGLQVAAPRRRIGKIAVCVDACRATIAQAIAQKADFMIVHHGLFWGAKAPVTGAYYERLALLIKNDLPLYSCHLPLDIHPEVGNNAVLARKLGLEPTGTFGEFEGTPIGVTAQTAMSRGEFVERVKAVLNVNPLVIATGPEVVRRVAILTGGGGSLIAKAALVADTFLTGEGNHHTYFEAEERGVNVLYAGHYATETVGVRALGDHLAARFNVEPIFIAHPTGL